ncbi:MAG: radical SAM protein [Treponema sp.]|nr:radical SAM protein [Treponema sp.]
MFDEKSLLEKQKKLLYGRQMFDVELTTNCNKKCYLCPREKLTRTNLSMTKATFEILLDWLPSDCDVFFAGFGEPLLHEKCTEFVKHLYNSGRRTSIMTNGILLSAKKIAELFDAGLEKLQISIMQKTDLEKIPHFVKIISAEYKNRVVFNIIKEKEMNDDSEMLSFLNDNEMKHCIKIAHNRAGLLYSAFHNDELLTCATFFCDTYINADGEIQVCSSDINNLHGIGSIHSMTFAELVEYKKQFLGNKEICQICANCTDEYRLKHFEGVK